jgi:hypothetical protein
MGQNYNWTAKIKLENGVITANHGDATLKNDNDLFKKLDEVYRRELGIGVVEVDVTWWEK